MHLALRSLCNVDSRLTALRLWHQYETGHGAQISKSAGWLVGWLAGWLAGVWWLHVRDVKGLKTRLSQTNELNKFILVDTYPGRLAFLEKGDYWLVSVSG